MSIFDNIPNLITKSVNFFRPKEVSKSADDYTIGSKGIIDENIYGSAEQGLPTEVDFTILFRIYKNVAWVRACVDIITRTAIAREFTIDPVVGFENSNERNEQKLRHFLAYPNPEDSFEEIISDVSTDLNIYGNAYIENVIAPNGDLREIYNLDATTMRVIPDEHGKILGYVQIPQSSGTQVFFEPHEITHFKLTSKGGGVYGLSPLVTLARSIDSDLKAQIYIAKYFENFGAPKALFKIKNATPEQVSRNRLYLATQIAGVENAHRNLILEGDVDYQPLSTNFRDSEILTVRKYFRDEIFAIYGVPPGKVSIIETGNIGSGSGESQDRTFKLENIKPLQRRIMQKFNHKITKSLMNIFDWEIHFGDIIDVNRKEETEIYTSLVDKKVLSPDEVREELGYEPKYKVRYELKKKEKEFFDGLVESGEITEEELLDEEEVTEGELIDTEGKDEEESEPTIDPEVEPVLAVSKKLDIDFDRFEPHRQKMQKAIEAFTLQKISEVKSKIEEHARNN